MKDWYYNDNVGGMVEYEISSYMPMYKSKEEEKRCKREVRWWLIKNSAMALAIIVLGGAALIFIGGFAADKNFRAEVKSWFTKQKIENTR